MLVFAAVASLFVSPVKAQTYCSSDWLGPDYATTWCETYTVCGGGSPEWCRPWMPVKNLTIPSMESMVNYCLLQGVPESTKQLCYAAYCYGRQAAIDDYFNCVGAIKYPDRITYSHPTDDCSGPSTCSTLGTWVKCNSTAYLQCQATLNSKLAALRNEFCTCLISQTNSPNYHAVETVNDELFYLLP